MELKQFIENFAGTLEIEAATLTGETEYRTLEEWSSFTALAIIAMIDSEYDVSIMVKSMRDTKTINELFELVKSELE